MTGPSGHRGRSGGGGQGGGGGGGGRSGIGGPARNPAANAGESVLAVHGGYRKLQSFQVAQLVYDLVWEVYEHVKFDVHGADVDAAERNRLGDVLNAALPPTSRDLRREAGEDL